MGQKTMVFLIDGCADEPLAELGGKTPLEYVDTPYMDRIAAKGASGTLLTLPEGFPTSSDAANMSVLGFDLAKYYTGRGALESLSQGIDLQPTDVGFRCNLIDADGDTLVDYSGGHVEHEDAVKLTEALAAEFNCAEYSFHPGISFRSLLVLHGEQFTDDVLYEKPDDHPGGHIPDLLPQGVPGNAASERTAAVLRDLMARTRPFLEAQPYNAARTKERANAIWPWSPGRRPAMRPFVETYGCTGAMVSEVDVIFGIGAAAGMTLYRVDGTTAYIDTNYEGMADAALEAIKTHDFVYLHVEAADETGHMGRLDLKLQAIGDIENRMIKRVMDALGDDGITYAVLPDHPVPVHLRKHTRTPVPVSICGPHITPDAITRYSEQLAPDGGLGHMVGDGFMRRVLNLG